MLLSSGVLRKLENRVRGRGRLKRIIGIDYKSVMKRNPTMSVEKGNDEKEKAIRERRGIVERRTTDSVVKG